MACSDFAILQSPPPSPSPPLPVAAKVSRPPRRCRSPSPPRSAALPVAAKVSRPPHCRSSPSPSLPLAAAQPAPSLSQEHRPSRSQEHRPLAQPAETRTPAARAAKQVHTTFFSKTREMRSLTRCRRRQRGLYADGAPHNGLREVDEARSSGLHASKVEGSHPDNFGFSRKI